MEGDGRNYFLDYRFKEVRKLLVREMRPGLPNY